MAVDIVLQSASSKLSLLLRSFCARVFHCEHIPKGMNRLHRGVIHTSVVSLSWRHMTAARWLRTSGDTSLRMEGSWVHFGVDRHVHLLAFRCPMKRGKGCGYCYNGSLLEIRKNEINSVVVKQEIRQRQPGRSNRNKTSIDTVVHARGKQKSVLLHHRTGCPPAGLPNKSNRPCCNTADTTRNYAIHQTQAVGWTSRG